MLMYSINDDDGKRITVLIYYVKRDIGDSFIASAKTALVCYVALVSGYFARPTRWKECINNIYANKH
jgi:hypothetical protein